MAIPALASAEEPTKTYPDCGREPTDAEVAAAKGAFQAGNASFNEADYARAIDYWEDAYRRDCTANPLLLNLARAYELAGRKRQAVVALETFLAREPNSGEKDQINRRVDVLKKKIAEEDAAVAALPPPAATGAAAANGAGNAPVEPAPAPQARRSVGPWIVIGVGGVATLVGIGGLTTNKKKLDEATAECGAGGRAECDSQEAIDKGNDARTAMNVSGVLLGVGLAAVAGGVVWAVLDGKRVAKANAASAERGRRLTLLPMLGPKFSGVSLSGSF
ncbi:MAG TPA: hypothetical protein VIW29_02820 [Polyangiaceae bacterium]